MTERMLKFVDVEQRRPDKRAAGKRSDDFEEIYREFETARAKAEENARLVEPQTDPTKMQGYHRLLGLIELKSGNPQGAVEHYQQANPNAIMVKYHHALALEDTGTQDEASRLFKEVAEWNFNSAAYACVRNDAIQKVEAAM